MRKYFRIDRQARGARRTRQRGFTLMELMTALAVAGVILGFAVPNFRVFMLNNRLTSAANDLLVSTNRARAEAIKRQLPVAVCATANPNATVPTCSGGPYTAWVVWVDANDNWVPDNNANEPVLERHAALDSTITVRSEAGASRGRIKYLGTGFASPASGGFVPTANIVMCDQRGTALTTGGISAARAMPITATGRVRISKIKSEVDATVAALGLSCP